MNTELRLVTHWLVDASTQVAPEYFQLPVAGQEEPEYRERVYCYELYHRWRCHWAQEFPFSLSGEVDKSGHPLIRGNAKPDFLVHVPGQMINLLVMEVKPANAEVGRIVDDLEKLTQYRRDLTDQHGSPANYHAAYLWVYGLSVEQWPDLRARLLEACASRSRVDHHLVSCFVHGRLGEVASQVAWQ